VWYVSLICLYWPRASFGDQFDVKKERKQQNKELGGYHYDFPNNKLPLRKFILYIPTTTTNIYYFKG